MSASFCSFFFFMFSKIKKSYKKEKYGHGYDVFKSIQSSWIGKT